MIPGWRIEIGRAVFIGEGVVAENHAMNAQCDPVGADMGPGQAILSLVARAAVRHGQNRLIGYQGDPAAPAIFNYTLDDISKSFCRTVDRDENWGTRLQDGSRVCLLLFADNFRLIATSVQELPDMIQ